MALVALGVAGAASVGFTDSFASNAPGSAAGSTTPTAVLCETIGGVKTCTTAPVTTTSAPPGSTTGSTSTQAQSPKAGGTTSTGAATTTAGTTTTTAPTVTTSAASSTLIVTGHGWGHGMGMAQWGAYGYALHGWTDTAILTHYYTGTTIGPGPSPIVKVLLADRQRRLTLSSAAPWQVVDGAGTKVALPAGKFVLRPSFVVAGKTLVSPLTFSSATAPLQLGKKPYHGTFVVISNGTREQIVNDVGLESYVDGVVGSEMPSNWPAAALQAQAIAARSYALAQLETVVTAEHVRCLRRHEKPGLRRNRCRDGLDARRRSARPPTRSCSTRARWRRPTSRPAPGARPCLRPRRSGRRSRTSSPFPIPTTRSLRSTTGGRC